MNKSFIQERKCSPRKNAHSPKGPHPKGNLRGGGEREDDAKFVTRRESRETPSEGRVEGRKIRGGANSSQARKDDVENTSEKVAASYRNPTRGKKNLEEKKSIVNRMQGKKNF